MSYKIEITLCQQWNFAPKAASLAEELYGHFRARVENINLVTSSGGAFEVSVNGQQIYSKLETGQFPTHEEIINKMEQLSS